MMKVLDYIKSVLVVLLLTASACLSSCADEECLEISVASETSDNTQGKTRGESTMRSAADAISLADAHRRTTRSGSKVSSVLPVVDDKETVAYVINYDDEQGFAIVAANQTVDKILAYSDRGNFSFENELSKLYFVDNIKEYVELSTRDVNDNIESVVAAASKHVIHEPIIQIELGQRKPFNQVVDKYYPGCPVGCGPVAAVTIMAYCKPELVLNNRLYSFEGINTALVVGPDYNPFPNIGVLGLDTPPMVWIDSYNGAISAMSQLLYDMGQLMHANYTTSGTSAYLSNASSAIKKAGYTVSGTRAFNTSQMVEMIDSEYIYFQHGSSPHGGHFWVIDGYDYTLDSSNQISDCYFYCHWGWYGSSDGYFLSDLFKPNSTYHFTAGYNFYVKIEK